MSGQDNNSIFYESVPDTDALDPLPDPVVMMKPLPSVEQPTPSEALSFRETGTEPSADDSAETDGGGDKTDEEVARALHDKLNT